MKKINYSLFTLLILSLTIFTFSSCGEETCEQGDWVGTYTGDAVETISGQENMGTATVTISASETENISVSYSYIVGGTENSITFDPFPASGCEITQSASDSGSGVDINITMSLDGNDITVQSTLTGGIESEVIITASK